MKLNPALLAQAVFVVVALSLQWLTAEAASARFPTVDMMALTSDRIELVRVTAPRDTSGLPLFAHGRVLHYQTLARLLGSGRATGSIRVHVLAPELLPQEGDLLLMLWDAAGREAFDVTAIDLTDLRRGYGMPAVTSDCRVAHHSDSLLAIVVLRVAMIQAGCPLGDDRQLSLAEFVAGKGSVEAWMAEDCEAENLNPLNLNALARPADGKMVPSCREEVARQLRRIPARGVPILHRALALAQRSLRER